MKSELMLEKNREPPSKFESANLIYSDGDLIENIRETGTFQKSKHTVESNPHCPPSVYFLKSSLLNE